MKIARPTWLHTLNIPDVVGAVVAVRVPHPADPTRTAVATRAYLDPDVPLRAVHGMERMLDASADGVAEMFNVDTEFAEPAPKQLGDGKTVDTGDRDAWTWEREEGPAAEEPICVAQRSDGRWFITASHDDKGFTILLPDDQKLIERVKLHLRVRGEAAH